MSAVEQHVRLEAREPPEARGVARDSVRMLVSSRRKGSIVHGRFRGVIQPTGLRPRFLDRLIDQGVHFPSELFQHESGSVPLAMRR